MITEYLFKIKADDAGERIDVFLSKKIGRSREYCKQLIEMENVNLINARNILKSSYHVKLNDSIFVKIPEEKPFE
jgi:RNA-binding protein YlmH